MRKTVLTVLVATLAAATTVQVVAAAEHHARKARAPLSEQFRNSNAYAAPAYGAVQPAWTPVQHYDTPSYDDPSKWGGQPRY